MSYLKNILVLFTLFITPFIALASNTDAKVDENSFRILDIIAKKRDNIELTQKEINYFVQEYAKGNIVDYQASSFLMATFINGMSADEISFLTDSMIHSGSVMRFDDIKEPIVDKHSTGGVGDKTSLILAPICAALDLKVPMISGRGLGHTGGTLDKLESIPGYKVDQDFDSYKKLVKDVGVCIIGQTKDIAPADKKIYALRDVSGSVESIPLIASSIMSKKMAEGLDVLVMDVKTGKGAFIKEYDKSLQLAQTMLNIGKKLNTKVITIVSDMNQPLGMCVGNSLEIIESVQILKGECLPAQEDLKTLSFQLAAQMLIATNKALDEKDAMDQISKVIEDGSAFEKFKQMVEAQGGDSKSLDDYTQLPTSNYKYILKAEKSGYIKTLDALKIAKGCSILGGSRQTIDDTIDFSVGTIIYKKIGDFVQIGDDLLEIHYNDENKLKNALSFFEDAYRFDENEVTKPILIKKILK
ncbi:MAG: Pyrimidine-nucleoside phosphorylase [Candidatus Anoxychlamydiales bacterium]|nr:Pyrimidine-nucleoside phosphorylase [Candidatus Anoxychlamydiales bacterium]